MPRTRGCAGCVAKDAEIQFLRQQLVEAQDRLLAAMNPAALAQLRGRVAPGATIGAVESYIDDSGKVYVTIGGRAVPLEEYQRLMAEKSSVVTSDGLIPAEEHRAAMDKLNEMLGGTS